MNSIDFRQKLHDARLEVFRSEYELGTDFLNEGVDLDKSFLELCDAAEGRGAEVSVGTVDELRAVLLSDPLILHGGLTPVGPSLRLSWHGKIRKFCLGVDPDAALEGGDGMKLRLLAWSGDWPSCHFEEDRGVASIEDFFDALVDEVAVIQQEAQAVSRIAAIDPVEAPAVLRRVPLPLSKLDYAAAVVSPVAVALVLANARFVELSVPLMVTAWAAGLLLMIVGIWRLKLASEDPSIGYGGGIWRWLVGAGFISGITFWRMLTVAPVWISPEHVDLFGGHSTF